MVDSKFLKDNIVLVIGLALPVIMVMVFLAATVLPRSLTPAPQYTLLFATGRYDYATAPPAQISFFVADGVLKVRVAKSDSKNQTYRTWKLMLYDVKNDSVREIVYDPAKLNATADGEAVLDETKDMRIDPALKAPDGYEFEGARYIHGGLVQDLFGGGSRNRGPRIKKGAAAYKIPNPYNTSYYYGEVQFVGWVVKLQ